jgi:putative ABC transport system permease protein
VTQQTRQIGVMKAVGAKPGQLVAMYFAMVAVYGIAALAIAVPVGQYLSNEFIDFAVSKLNWLVTDYSMPTPILAMELAVGLLVPIMAASVPVLLGMRMPVREALYSQGINASEFGEGFFDRVLGRLRGLSRPDMLALRNTFIRKGRLALTLTTLTLAAAVFMSVASVRSSINVTVGRIGLHRAYDLWATLVQDRPENELVRETKTVRGVTGAEAWLTVSGVRVRPDRTESQSIFLYGLPWDTTYFRPELTAGRWLRADDKNAVVVDTGFLKDEPDVGVGSVIEVKANGVDEWYHVVGIVRGDFLNPFVYADRTSIQKILNLRGSTNMVVVRTAQHGKDYQIAAAKRVTDHFTEKGLAVTSSESQEELKQTIADSLNIVVVFLVIMAGLLVAVGGIGLSGTMSINVMESTREIGVMRAIGASNGSVYRVFITEGVVVGVISWGIGAVLAVPMSYALTIALARAMGFPLTWGFSFEGVGAWLAFVIVIAVLASLLPAFRAARVSVAEAIAYE